ncbi:DUF1648 domain-containing protein [Leucobacter insecticola]|uniref:DUF1648 domain-containing protein n=1 Tax=Leucobacter insecticola TaxID=2714934 RepID=A0A6G8FK22_9MICO|nr:DUF1648 domain-containing protein [Leucobacter insecticola]QIM16698.1 DUF1648 domain-containing protein [Leucobacter insecticola]
MNDMHDALTEEQSSELKRARRAARFVGLFLPLLVAVSGALIMALWVPRLPNPTATHWGMNGEPNGFGSPWFNVIGIFGISLFLSALSLLQSVQMLQKPGAAVWSAMNRLLPAIMLGAVVMIQVAIMLMMVP